MEAKKFYTLEEIEDKYIGEKGTPKRDAYEEELNSFLIGEAIKQARQSKNLTQEELGNLIGVQRAQISRIENGKNLTFSTIARVFKAMGISAKLEIGSMVSITVTEKGPFLVYGRPPLAEQFIMPNEQNESWYFQEGRRFSTEAEPTALCRCGASKRKPYCDGSHETATWDPTLTAPYESLLDKAETVEGGTLTMTDNPKYCVFARFCHPGGDAWTLTERSADPEARQLAIREASMCPGGRLTAWDRKTGSPYEFRFAPSLGLIEDVTIGSSGGLWIRGGIPLRREDGHTYEIRNRVVACRCGQSANKPYCDGTHAAIKWRDNLEGEPVGETLPEEVY